MKVGEGYEGFNPFEQRPKKEKNDLFDAYEIVENILYKNEIKTIEESGEMRLYQNGYYKKDQKRIVNKIISDTLKRLSLKFNLSRRNSLLQLIENETLESVNNFDTNPYILNLSNCLLDIRTNKRIKHTPTYLSSRRIPITYDPDAKCSNIQNFLEDVFDEDDMPFILEYSGLSLTPIMIYQLAIMLYGTGNNGKTTFLNLLSKFIGVDNIAKVDPSQLNKGHITWTMEDKTLNICSDIETKKFNVRKFNQYVGNDFLILIDRKFKDPYMIKPTAKLIYTCNETFPQVDTDTDKGFWRKWNITCCTNSFDDKEDKNILDKLTTKKELSGFLNLCIEAFQKLHKNKKFSKTKYQNWKGVKDFWFKKLHILVEFIEVKIIQDPSFYIPKNVLLTEIINYMKERGLNDKMNKNILTRRLHALGFEDDRRRDIYFGLKLKKNKQSKQSQI